MSDFPEATQIHASHVPSKVPAGPFGSDLVPKDYAPSGVLVIRDKRLDELNRGHLSDEGWEVAAAEPASADGE